MNESREEPGWKAFQAIMLSTNQGFMCLGVLIGALAAGLAEDGYTTWVLVGGACIGIAWNWRRFLRIMEHDEP